MGAGLGFGYGDGRGGVYIRICSYLGTCVMGPRVASSFIYKSHEAKCSFITYTGHVVLYSVNA